MTTQTRIAEERSRYQAAGYPTFIVEHDGELFTCFVLPLTRSQNLKPLSESLSDCVRRRKRRPRTRPSPFKKETGTFLMP